MTNLMRGTILALSLTLMACEGQTPTASDVGAASFSKSGSAPSGGKKGGGTGGGGTGGSAPATITYLSTQAGASALQTASVSFWAVQGKDRSVEIDYVTGGRFLRFSVRKNTQMVRPNGTAIADGDSILITITVTDAARLLTQFEPSGLRFNGGGSARLNMSYAEVGADLNDDGVVNGADTTLENALSIFRQETATSPWFKVPSSVSSSLDEVESVIGGFTNYVIAY